MRGGVGHARGENDPAGADGLARDAVEPGQFGVLVDPGDAYVDEVLLRLQGARSDQGARMPDPGLVGGRNAQGRQGRDGDGGTGVGDVGHYFEGTP